jgi:nucleotide-binding universal stress UspA family protein
MHRMLVPLDGSPLAETIMPTAIDIGQALGAEWVLLRVVTPFPATWAMVADGAWGPVAEWETVMRTQEDAKQDAEAYLRRVRDRMGVPVERVAEDVREGSLPGAILQAVHDHGATLIAMSTHGRGGLNRLVMGSVTDLVVRLSTVPVIVVHPPTVG